MEKMALQQLLQKHKNAIVAVGFNAVAIPLMYKFNHKTLLSSQLINIGIQLGTQVYVAAISGPSMFANLDPDTFADIQAVLFPRWAICVILLVFTISHRFPSNIDTFSSTPRPRSWLSWVT